MNIRVLVTHSDGTVVELACIVSLSILQDNLIFSVDEQANEILLEIFGQGGAGNAGVLPTQTITLQSTDDLSAVTLQSLLDSGQLIVA